MRIPLSRSESMLASSSAAAEQGGPRLHRSNLSGFLSTFAKFKCICGASLGHPYCLNYQVRTSGGT